MTNQELDKRALEHYMKMSPHSDETMLLQKVRAVEARVGTKQSVERWVVRQALKELEEILG